MRKRVQFFIEKLTFQIHANIEPDKCEDLVVYLKIQQKFEPMHAFFLVIDSACLISLRHDSARKNNIALLMQKYLYDTTII